ncbi:MAG: hypothetical protein Q3M24_16495 [Candidatus Electrothrix aestuarii]|uniref:Uncharacterized protein n=1 Tax=Candidatus Electrothrix aestuarii TaxID=3062594 RepID=A0AAU8LSM8_9BACT|nr:hypothetical protein [Candidatus Electrothrix aestuarii]WPD21596.1 MAG: hypothetical protein SD837_15470 [Candidatus Electrothrix sp. GW3-3]
MNTMPLPSSHRPNRQRPEPDSKVVRPSEPDRKRHAEWINWRINFFGSSFTEAFEELHNLNPGDTE